MSRGRIQARSTTILLSVRENSILTPYKADPPGLLLLVFYSQTVLISAPSWIIRSQNAPGSDYLACAPSLSHARVRSL
ncbi:hypothetical protein BDV19DRAFT_369530 [Aspergillus venezuelensis]